MYQSNYPPTQQNTPSLTESESLGLLKHLNKDELQQLLENDDRLDAMIKDLPHVKKMGSEKQVMIASNRSLADFILAQESRLTVGREELSEAYDRAVKLQEEVLENKSRLLSCNDDLSVETALVLLKTEATKVEDESEKIADQFIDKDMDLETFVETFMEKRMSSHLKKIKAEKMDELVKQQRGRTQIANSWSDSSEMAGYGRFLAR